jgi:hypothetical protein
MLAMRHYRKTSKNQSAIDVVNDAIATLRIAMQRLIVVAKLKNGLRFFLAFPNKI